MKYLYSSVIIILNNSFLRPWKVLEGMSLESEKVNEEREEGMELSRQVIPQHSLDDGEGRTQINKYKVIVIKINRHRGY